MEQRSVKCESSRAYQLTTDRCCKKAFLKGLDHMLKAQYSNGGWPQSYPLSKNYQRYITFNDDCTIRVMELLREIATRDDFEFVDKDRRTAAKNAVARGVDCILKCQVIVNGTLTVWCAQHDEVTFAPTTGRSFELASLSGAESAGILIFLMSIENPSPEVIRSINAGAMWYAATKIEGDRYVRSEKETNLVKDPKAGPLWARLYEIDSNRPFFSDRDGVVNYDIEEISEERRGSYSWYGK